MKVFVCRSGEIGRRPGLKIPCDESHVPVRARFPAPILLFRFAGTARQTLFHPKRQYRGVEQLVARRAHNPEVVWFKSHPRNHKRNLFCLPRQERFFLAFWAKYRANIRKTGFGSVDWLLRSSIFCFQRQKQSENVGVQIEFLCSASNY